MASDKWPFARRLEALFPDLIHFGVDHGVPVVNLVWHEDDKGRMVTFEQYLRDPDPDPALEVWSPTFFADDGVIVGSENAGGEDRPCPQCHLFATWDGNPPPESSEADPDYGCQMPPDPCLGWLPGVSNACCGHGWASSRLNVSHEPSSMRDADDGWIYPTPYVAFADGPVIRGIEADAILRDLAQSSPALSGQREKGSGYESEHAEALGAGQVEPGRRAPAARHRRRR